MKQNIRSLMINLRKKIDLETKEIYEKSIVEKIIKDPDYQKAKTVAIYMPMTYEINLLSLINEDKIFLIPRVDGKEIVFVKYHQDMMMQISSFGVLEPSQDETIYGKSIDYMIVPALAISKEMYRIGYGKGFYDRYLKNKRPHKAMGVIYPFQEIETFIYDEYDEKLDGYYLGEV